MSINEEYFYQKTEGFLGEEKDCKVLFLMREPNSKEKVTKDDFWFKKVVNGKKLPRSGCYLSKLGQIASLLLGIHAEINEQRIPALKQAVYINMNPVCGKGLASDEYQKAIKLFKEEKDECEILNEKYISRWKIIDGMPDQSTIVTVGDIYDAMKYVLEKRGYDLIEDNAPRLVIRNRPPMRSFVIKDRGINVMKIIHPAAFRRNHYRAEDLSLK